jgi:uncharacterized protein with ParB-like and HNH nuclease domain
MTSETNGSMWFDDYVNEQDDRDNDAIDYDLSATPNDFNVSTLFNYIESGIIIIPGFQRHYVWDVKRASKLIESLILGLPVPQLFLYEEARNKLLVIDGQQRLMSIYYFIKQRFPRIEARSKLREVFKDEGTIPDHVLHDDKYFTNFRLQLPAQLPGQTNPLKGLSYATLGDRKLQLDLRPIRNVVVKQNSPKDDDSSIYEIFSRLNSGGVNLRPQEIRLSLYHSDFYDILTAMNADARWRKILGNREPDLHMKDVEVLLRIFAMLIDADNYSPSMVKFLNQFSRKCKTQNQEKNSYLQRLLDSFLDAASDLPRDAFLNKSTRRFNIALIEAVFTAACYKAFDEKRPVRGRLDPKALQDLEMDEQFTGAASYATTQTTNVQTRLERGKHFVEAL